MTYWLILTGAILLGVIVGVATIAKVRYHGPIRGTAYNYRPYQGQRIWRV
jgi:hypothetical protein